MVFQASRNHNQRKRLKKEKRRRKLLLFLFTGHLFSVKLGKSRKGKYFARELFWQSIRA
jgi:hypothetical protein